jgi:hypothetical protein
MMLSASAARLGCVKTTVRQMGKARGFSAAIGNREVALRSVGKRNKANFQFRVTLASDVSRRQSTMASYSDSDAEETVWDKSRGHAEALKIRRDFPTEPWTVNLGRGDNNEWLLGPRDPDEWFTGLKPSLCAGELWSRESYWELRYWELHRLTMSFFKPGADTRGVIRSLPLPKLDAVTREGAKEYFDNSWTLYETLFAGLRGEEYFYR